MVVSQDESEEITDDHDPEDDLDHDADDLDDVDVDVGEDAAEHLGTEDLDIQTKEKEIIQVIFLRSKHNCCVLQLNHTLEYLILVQLRLLIDEGRKM